jgi:hypothetical protein
LNQKSGIESIPLRRAVVGVRFWRADPEAIRALGCDKTGNILDAWIREVNNLHSHLSTAVYSPVPFNGDKNLSPLMAAMVTAAAPEGAKAVRSVFRSVIVAALCAGLSHPSCNWMYQTLIYNIAVACCQIVVTILV